MIHSRQGQCDTHTHTHTHTHSCRHLRTGRVVRAHLPPACHDRPQNPIGSSCNIPGWHSGAHRRANRQLTASHHMTEPPPFQVIAYTTLDIKRTTELNERPLTDDQRQALAAYVQNLQDRRAPPPGQLNSRDQLCVLGIRGTGRDMKRCASRQGAGSAEQGCTLR